MKPPRPSILPAREQPSRSKAPTAQQIAAASPWLPRDYERADVVAFQALASGTADASQQKRALKWLIETGCMTYEMTYFPGPDGPRNSDFAQGMRSVGLQVVKLLKLNPGLVKASNPNADPYEEKT